MEDQVLDLQRDALREAGCERIFEEKKSGANKCRPALNTALRTLRAGDVLVVWKRPARTVAAAGSLPHI